MTLLVGINLFRNFILFVRSQKGDNDYKWPRLAQIFTAKLEECNYGTSAESKLVNGKKISNDP